VIKILTIFLIVLSLTACTKQLNDRDIYTQSSLKPVSIDIEINEKALEECLQPSSKPKSRLVKEVLIAWQKDRNRLRDCANKNKIKIDIIKQIIKKYE
jgi:hypothetical protein